MDFRHPGHTALVLFTRTREEEARAKDFSSTNRLRTNSLIAGHLISHAEQTARNTGLPCFVISSRMQHGNSFGEKLAHAFEDIYQLGYTGVIAIGNDCPTLTTADLLRAAETLETDGAVMGPARDGGVYLIGMRREYYQAETLAALPWSSSQVHHALEVYFQQRNISFINIGLRADIDDATALASMLQHAKLIPSLQQLLTSLLSFLHIHRKLRDVNPIIASLRIYGGLRAPPAC